MTLLLRLRGMAGLSLGLFRKNRSLLLFPLLSAASLLLPLGALAALAVSYGRWMEHAPRGRAAEDAMLRFTLGSPWLPVLAAGAFLAVAATFFLNAALNGAVLATLEGHPPTFTGALGIAWRRKGRLFRWALVSWSMSVVLLFLGRLVPGGKAALANWLAWPVVVGWRLGTSLVVPVLLFEEERGTREAISRSAGLLGRVGGELLLIDFGRGFLKVVPLALLLLFLFFAPVNPFLALALLGAAALLLFGVVALGRGFDAAMAGVVYSYAVTGVPPSEFQTYLKETAP